MNLFVLGIFIGFVSYCITAPIEGHFSRSCRIPLGNKFLHIHHWMYLIPVLFFSTNIVLSGFCIGGIFQGIVMYSDWYKIWY